MGECNLWFTQLQATGLFPNDTLRLNLTKKRNMLRPIATIAVNVPQAVFLLSYSPADLLGNHSVAADRGLSQPVDPRLRQS